MTLKTCWRANIYSSASRLSWSGFRIGNVVQAPTQRQTHNGSHQSIKMYFILYQTVHFTNMRDDARAHRVAWFEWVFFVCRCVCRFTKYYKCYTAIYRQFLLRYKMTNSQRPSLSWGLQFTLTVGTRRVSSVHVCACVRACIALCAQEIHQPHWRSWKG